MFTSINSPYMQDDEEISNLLAFAKRYAKEKQISLSIPRPFDSRETQCGSFWTRFQTWPVKGNTPARYHENVIIGGCNAVVRGNLSTLGYIFDYGDIMSLWNNEHFKHYRKELIEGRYPDSECANCQNYGD